MNHIKCLVVSEDIYKPVLVKEEILDPYLMEIQVLRIDRQVVELYIIAAQLKYRHYLELYEHTIECVDIIIFHLKQSTAKSYDFRNWIKIIPISANPKLVFIIQTNTSTIVSGFQSKLQRYWKKPVDASIVFLNSTVDRDQIMSKIIQTREELISIKDYLPESNTISRVKSFFKFGAKQIKEELMARDDSVV